MPSKAHLTGGQDLVKAVNPAWIFTTLRGYQPSWLPADLIAGLMLAAISIPEQLATASLAGLDPHTGLYALIAGSIGIAAFGANRFASAGADSTIAPIFAGALAAMAASGSAQYAGLATALALLVGAILIVAGVMRAGWIADLLSIPVTCGFLAGISVHIIVGELPSILGIADSHGRLMDRMVDLVRHASAVNPYALAIGGAVLAVTMVSEQISPRVPGALIGLAGAAVAVVGLHLEAHGITVLKPLPSGVPALTLPTIADAQNIFSLLPTALVVAAVCMMQTAAVVRSFPSDPDQPEDVSRDFSGVGAGCVVAGLIGAFPVDCSPPCTAIVKESGGRSQLASLTQVAMAVALMFFAPGWSAYIPQAALGGLLIFIGMRIFRLREMIAIAQRGGYEIYLVAACAALVILMPIETGMLLSIVLSLVHNLYIVARPYCVELERVPGTTVWWPPPPGRENAVERVPGVIVFAPAAPIYFTNADYVCEKLKRIVASTDRPVRLVVIEATGVIDLDYTGAQVLKRTIVQLRDAGVDVAMARMEAQRARAAAAQTGLLDTVGEDHLFRSVQEAVTALNPS